MNQKKTSINTPWTNVAITSHIASFLRTGKELNAFANINSTTREAIDKYSYDTFDRLTTQKNIDRDAWGDDITLALKALQMGKRIDYGFLLTILCTKSKVRKLDSLFKNGLPIDTSVSTGDTRTVLHMACESNDMQMFNMVMTHNPNVNMVASIWRTWSVIIDYPLASASGAGNMYMVRALLDSGATFFPPGADETALDVACFHGQLEIVRYLVEQGNDVNSRNAKDKTCLSSAIKGGNRNVVDFLFNNGIKPNQNDIESAIEVLDLPILERIIANGLRIDMSMALTFMATVEFSRREKCGKMQEMFDYFISKGANINSRDENDQTPLFHAMQNSAQMTYLLVREGANLDNISYDFQNAFGVFFMMKSDGIEGALMEDIFEILVARGDVDSCGGKGKLMEACILHGYEKGVRFLIKCGYDVSELVGSWENMETPLVFACRCKNRWIAKLLLENGANPNGDAKGDYTVPLMKALDDYELCVSLVEHGANVNGDPDREGNPFKEAMREENEDLITLFCKNGANFANWFEDEVIEYVFNGRNLEILMSYKDIIDFIVEGKSFTKIAQKAKDKKAIALLLSI